MKNYFKIFKSKIWANKFKKRCNGYGANLKIQGPVKFSGGGKLHCGDDFFVRSTEVDPVKIYISENADLSFGNQVFLNNRVHISCSNKIKLGTHVDVGDECLIIDNDFHNVGDTPSKDAPIIIEDNVWIATRVIILKGVTIGEGSVIGAGSLVTKSIPSNSFAAGNPAKVIKSLK
mgnify:CR=1 FL=1